MRDESLVELAGWFQGGKTRTCDMTLFLTHHFCFTISVHTMFLHKSTFLMARWLAQ